MNTKVTKIFSWPLMRQDLRSNLMLAVVVTLVMCMLSVVITFAGNILGTSDESENLTEVQSEFYQFLYVLASYNELMGTSLSYEDFVTAEDQTMYEPSLV